MATFMFAPISFFWRSAMSSSIVVGKVSSICEHRDFKTSSGLSEPELFGIFSTSSPRA